MSSLRGCAAVVLLGLALAARPAQAQIIMRDDDRHSSHIGITTGVGTTWLVDSKLLDDPNYRMVQTWRRAPIGFTFGYHFNNRNGFQVEVNKTNQGADFQIIDERDSDRRIGTKKAELTYWSIPVLYKYTAGAAQRVRFEFHVGPQINLLSAGSEVNRYDAAATLLVVRGKTDLTETNDPRGLTVRANTSQTLNKKADFRSRTISAVFGIGLEYRIHGPFYASSLIRASYSLDDVRSAKRVAEVKSTGYHNDRQSAVIGVQVGLHYQFIRRAEGHPKDRGN